MKSSELRKLIREEVRKTLTEAGTIPANVYTEATPEAKKLFAQLEDLALNGEIGNQDIEDLRSRLRSARSKMFAAKRSPEQRKASSEKAQLTKKFEKLKFDVASEVEKQLGIKDDAPQSLQLRLGTHPNRSLQKKFADKVEKLFINKAKAAGLEVDLATDYIKGQYFPMKGGQPIFNKI